MESTHSVRYFDWLDYMVFGGTLTLLALVGVYFAFCANRKQNTTLEYLVGNKKMGIFPISMSLIASYISGISLLGYPSEMYMYGTQIWVLIFAELMTCAVMATVYIPVFFNLQIYTTYEYLNRRFNSTVRTFGSILFLCKMVLYIPVVIYLPAMAFAQVSGFSLNVLIPTTCIVCIFYTTVGGIQAVVWTDTVQLTLTVLGAITVAVMGTFDVGGFKNVYDPNNQSGRIDFLNTSWDPTIRHTLWNVLLGKFFSHMARCTINQAMVQRCLSIPSLAKARITIGIFAIGTMLLVCLSCYTGLVIYAAFADCDPLTTGVVRKADQIMPYFVMKITSHVPTLPGIIVTGVFGASLSTMSTGLNSISGVTMEDFIRPNYKNLTEKRASLFMKVITVVAGIICTLLAFIVDKFDGIYQSSGSLEAITGGTLLGMFTLGMLFPWANAKGALAGGAAAGLFVAWICIGSQLAIYQKHITYPTKPVSIEGCDNTTLFNYYNLQSEKGAIPEHAVEAPFPLYTISYMYFTIIGLLIVIIVGMIVSWLTGFNDPSEMDPLVFSPIIHRFLKSKKNQGKLSKVEDNEKMAEVIPAEQMKPLIDKDICIAKITLSPLRNY